MRKAEAVRKLERKKGSWSANVLLLYRRERERESEWVETEKGTRKMWKLSMKTTIWVL